MKGSIHCVMSSKPYKHLLPRVWHGWNVDELGFKDLTANRVASTRLSFCFLVVVIHIERFNLPHTQVTLIYCCRPNFCLNEGRGMDICSCNFFFQNVPCSLRALWGESNREEEVDWTNKFFIATMQQVRAKAAHSYKAVHDTFYSVKVLKNLIFLPHILYRLCCFWVTSSSTRLS